MSTEKNRSRCLIKSASALGLSLIANSGKYLLKRCHILLVYLLLTNSQQMPIHLHQTNLLCMGPVLMHYTFENAFGAVFAIT